MWEAVTAQVPGCLRSFTNATALMSRASSSWSGGVLVFDQRPCDHNLVCNVAKAVLDLLRIHGKRALSVHHAGKLINGQASRIACPPPLERSRKIWVSGGTHRGLQYWETVVPYELPRTMCAKRHQHMLPAAGVQVLP